MSMSVSSSLEVTRLNEAIHHPCRGSQTNCIATHMWALKRHFRNFHWLVTHICTKTLYVDIAIDPSKSTYGKWKITHILSWRGYLVNRVTQGVKYVHISIQCIVFWFFKNDNQIIFRRHTRPSLCFKFKYTLKRMLQGFRSHWE